MLVIPIFAVDADGAIVSSFELGGETVAVSDEQKAALLAVLSKMKVRRALFFPQSIESGEESICIGLVTESGPLHVELHEHGYVYSSASDIVWYKIADSEQLRTSLLEIIE